MHRSLSRRIARPGLLLAVLCLGACRDLPSSPQALQMWAGGQGWVALEPPERLPDLATWLPYLRGGEADPGALSAVRAMEREAQRARAAGELHRAAELHRRAVDRAVRSLPRPPEPALFVEGLAAADGWMGRVRQGVPVDRVPGLGAALDAMKSDRERTVAALAAGDSLAAARHLSRAAERIRAWSPTETALRALDRAERGLVRQAAPGVARDRARHLVQSARAELVSGDPRRALQRALYALQLIGGAQMREAEPEAHPQCGELTC